MSGFSSCLADSYIPGCASARLGLQNAQHTREGKKRDYEVVKADTLGDLPIRLAS